MNSINYKVGDTIALHNTIDKALYLYLDYESFLTYKGEASYRKQTIVKIKRHWNYFFKKMYQLDNGLWYDVKDLKPIVKVYFQI